MSQRAGSRHPEYSLWCQMRARCRNPEHQSYHRYGARGITCDPRWESFSTFLADMGPRPSPNHSVDRYPDRLGNYEPGNCRWATAVEQGRNRTSSRAVICSDGRRFDTIIEAAEATASKAKSIRDVCIGRQATHRGLTWKFEDEGLPSRRDDPERPNKRRRGPAHPSSRLTEEIVRVIRISGLSDRALGRQFNVSHMAIKNVRDGRTWRHVQ